MTQTEIIQQIHNEFFTASDRLKGVSLSEKKIKKADTLKSLGFAKSKDVVVADKLRLTVEQIRAVDYYSFYYPQYKFITEDQVESICKKYSLIFGNVSNYKGSIPDAKVEDMKRFKLRKEDIIVRTEQRHGADFQWEVAKCYNPIVNLILAVFGYCPWGFLLFTFYQWRKRTQSFKICAPANEMELGRWEGIMMDWKIEAVPDPVVLQPVNGGYLIVTAWGDEASDESVVNEKMN
jgi:hypothetical protein